MRICSVNCACIVYFTCSTVYGTCVHTLYSSRQGRFGGISGWPIGFYYHQAHTPPQSSFWFWTLSLIFSFSDSEADEGGNFDEYNAFVLTPSLSQFFEIIEKLIFVKLINWKVRTTMTRRN